MNSFLNIIKFDYLQRTRSYAFLITLCISIALAYSFVPEPNASYSTISIAGHQGNYNAAWFGYVTAIMTSINLFLFGFYLVNAGIQKDVKTKVGIIVAATPISNSKYLFSKMLSNFLVLITIVFLVFLMSIFLFFLYNDGSSFELLKFVKPYLLVTAPAMFFLSVVAVVFEVVLGRFSVIQNVGFFFLFSCLIAISHNEQLAPVWDVLGSEIVIQEMEELVQATFHMDEKPGVSIGFSIGGIKNAKKFNFTGVNFPIAFVLSRLLWMVLSLGLIVLIAPIFHRFNIKEKAISKKKLAQPIQQKLVKNIISSKLPKASIDFSIFPLFKMELLLMMRSGKKWLWFLNGIGMILLSFLPLPIGHQFVLPILWFLQVSRLSRLTTKERSNNLQFLAFTSYKPLSRLLASQLLAGTSLMIFLAMPLLMRLAVSGDFSALILTASGGIFIVLLAAALGIVSKGKKLFEVLFFMMTYAAINGVFIVDYVGGTAHEFSYILYVFLIVSLLGVVSFLWRRQELRL